jgi:endonuclease III
VSIVVPAVDPRGLRTTLSVFRYGSGDPTTVVNPGGFLRATHTPDGPATLLVRWGIDSRSSGSAPIDAEAWGPGAPWMLGRVDRLIGAADHGVVDPLGHPVVARAVRNHPGLRIGASGTLFHDIVPVVLGQRITAGEAFAQWRRLVEALGEPAPGPFPTLRLPPTPRALVDRPTWWYHPLGVERRRAETIREIARRASHLWDWAELPAHDCAAKLVLLPGVGQWTIGSVLGPALGEPDAVAVGDFHLKNTVAHALAGEARGTDERMLELLEPYRGQRGRVVRLLQLDGHQAPKFGPRQRILPMRHW